MQRPEVGMTLAGLRNKSKAAEHQVGEKGKGQTMEGLVQTQ